MIKAIAFSITLLFSSSVLAQACPRTLVSEGTPSPCTGYLLSPDAMEEAVKLPKRISLLEEKLSIQESALLLKDEKIQVYMGGMEHKDKTIMLLNTALLEKDKNEALKLGLAIGLSAVGTALLCIGLAFAFSAASKVQITTP